MVLSMKKLYHNIFNISGLENNKLDVPLLLSDLSEMLGDFHDVAPWHKNHPAALAYNEPGTLVLIPTGCHAITPRSFGISVVTL